MLFVYDGLPVPVGFPIPVPVPEPPVLFRTPVPEVWKEKVEFAIGTTVGTLTEPVPGMVGLLVMLVRFAVVVGMGRVILVVPPTGPRPGISMGKHFEKSGRERTEKSFLVKVGFLLLPSVASRFRSTSMARVEVSWTPVLEDPRVCEQRPNSL